MTPQTPQTIRRARRENVVGGKFLSREQSPPGEAALIGAPRQYTYVPPVITTAAPYVPCNRVKLKAIAPTPTQCNICGVSFPSRRDWGLHNKECGKWTHAEGAD